MESLNRLLGEKEWDEAKLVDVAEKCRTQILKNASQNHGFASSELWARVDEFKLLTKEERFRVLVLLSKLPGVASVLGRAGGIRFFPAEDAPDWAFEYKTKEQKAEQLLRAADKAFK